MKIKLFTLALIVFSNMAKGQDIGLFACKILQTFKSVDTVSILELTIRPSDNLFIMKSQLKMYGNVDSLDIDNYELDKKSELSYQLFQKQLIDAFIVLRKKAEAMGVNWSKVDCNQYSFEIKKTLESPFMTANGKILLIDGAKEINIMLKGMIKLNERWKITYIDIQ